MVVAEIDPKADLRGIRLLKDVGVEQRSFLSGMAWAMTALGARPSQVLTTVAGGAFALVGAGTVLGTILGVTLAGFQSVMLIPTSHTCALRPRTR